MESDLTPNSTHLGISTDFRSGASIYDYERLGGYVSPNVTNKTMIHVESPHLEAPQIIPMYRTHQFVSTPPSQSIDEDKIERIIRERLDKVLNVRTPTSLRYQGLEASPQIKNDDAVVSQDANMPNYDTMTAAEQLASRNNFESLFNQIKSSFPTHNVIMPNFYQDLLPEIHMRYVTLVKDITIKETATRWKVYVLIAILVVELIFREYYKWEFMRGFSKSNIKIIHRYDHFLMELASKWYVSGNEEWSLPIRAMFSVGVSVAVFSAISIICQRLGMSGMVEQFHNMADSYMNSGGGGAPTNPGDIPAPPQPSEGMENPTTMMNLISALGPTFIGSNNVAPVTEQTSIPQAQPQEVRSKRSRRVIV